MAPQILALANKLLGAKGLLLPAGTVPLGHLSKALFSNDKVPLSRANQVGARFRALPRPLLICSAHIAVSRILKSLRLARARCAGRTRST